MAISNPIATMPTRGKLPLVGRADELAMLRAILNDVTNGRGKTVILHGEQGVGKTRLVQEIIGIAEDCGLSAVIGRAYPVETGMPYAPFADALVPLIQGFDRNALMTITRGRNDFGQIFPALSQDDARARDPLGASPSDLKTHLFWNFAEFLKRLGDKPRAPLLIVLENLQWADASSIELLHFVARKIDRARVVLLCTYSEAEGGSGTAFRQAEQSLVSLGAAKSHRLDPLSRAAVEELISKVFNTNQSVREFVALLYGWTRGNPFFVEETLKSLVESGQLKQRARRWTGFDVSDLGLPRSVRDAVATRIDRLGEAPRALADLMGVLGTRATFGELRAVSGRPQEELVAAVDELCRQRIIEVDGDQAYDFVHPIVRDTIYREIGPARAQTLHGLVAHALERHYAARAIEHASALAYHFRRAGAGDSTDSTPGAKAIRYLKAAGRTALAAYANREAADSLAQALDLLGRETRVDEIEPDVILVEDLAKARQRLGEYAAAEKLWHRVLRHAERIGRLDQVAAVEHRLGLASYWSGRFEEALHHYDSGISAARTNHSNALEARLLLARATCLQGLGMPAEAQRDADTALAIAERLGEPALRARVHRSLLLRYMWTGAVPLAREHGARLIALAGEANEPVLAWSGYWALAMLAGLTGESEEMARNLGQAERLAKEINSPIFQIWTDELTVSYKTAHGAWDDALSIAESAIENGRVLGQRTLTPRMLVWAAFIHLARGNADQGKRFIDEAWQLSGAERITTRGTHERHADIHSVVVAHIGRAYELMLNDPSEAIRIAKRGLEIADRSGYVVWAIYRLLPILAECYYRVNNIEQGEEVARRLRAESQRVGHRLGLAWALAAESIGPMLREDWDRAFTLVREGIAEMEAIPFIFDSARLRRELARRLAVVGRLGEAREEFLRARAVFAQLGAAREIAGMGEDLRRYGIKLPPMESPERSATERLAGLTRKEWAVALHVEQGMENKAIAEELGMSPNTVRTHLQNVYEKLDISGKWRLAELVREFLNRGGSPPPSA